MSLALAYWALLAAGGEALSWAQAYWICLLVWLASGALRKGAIPPAEGLGFILAVIVGVVLFGAPIK